MTSSSSYIYPHAVTAYRFHDVDPVPFEKSLVVTWENGMHKNGSLAASSQEPVFVPGLRVRATLWYAVLVRLKPI